MSHHARALYTVAKLTDEDDGGLWVTYSGADGRITGFKLPAKHAWVVDALTTVAEIVAECQGLGQKPRRFLSSVPEKMEDQ